MAAQASTVPNFCDNPEFVCITEPLPTATLHLRPFPFATPPPPPPTPSPQGSPIGAGQPSYVLAFFGIIGVFGLLGCVVTCRSLLFRRRRRALALPDYGGNGGPSIPEVAAMPPVMHELWLQQTGWKSSWQGIKAVQPVSSTVVMQQCKALATLQPLPTQGCPGDTAPGTVPAFAKLSMRLSRQKELSINEKEPFPVSVENEGPKEPPGKLATAVLITMPSTGQKQGSGEDAEPLPELAFGVCETDILWPRRMG